MPLPPIFFKDKLIKLIPRTKLVGAIQFAKNDTRFEITVYELAISDGPAFRVEVVCDAVTQQLLRQQPHLFPDLAEPGLKRTKDSPPARAGIRLMHGGVTETIFYDNTEQQGLRNFLKGLAEITYGKDSTFTAEDIEKIYTQLKEQSVSDNKGQGWQKA